MNRLAFLILISAITLPLCTGCVSSPPGATNPVAVTDGAGKATIAMPGLTLGEARLQAGISTLGLQNATRVIVPEIDLRTRATSLLMPVNSRRLLPLDLGLYGTSDLDRMVDVSYEIDPQQPDGLVVDGPNRIRFDRPKSFPLKPAVVATRTGEYSLTITVRDALSGKEDSLLIQVTVVERDGRLTPALYTPIAQPSGLTLGSSETRIRFVAQVSGPAYKPDSLSLEEVDANGKLLREPVAILLDNGQGQDEIPNDFVYSGTATISGAREGERYFRVKTLDRGVALLSGSRPFLVTRFPLELPKPDVRRLVKSAVDGTRIFRNQVVLFLDSEMSNDGRGVERLAESVNGRIIGVTPAIRQYVLEFEGGKDAAAVRDAIETVTQQAGVVSAYPNYEVRELASPSEAGTPVISSCLDDTADCQWYIEHVDAHLAWEQARVGTVPFEVAVMEPFGVAGTHGELSGKCHAGNGTNPCASGTHGTQVAGVLAAMGNNEGIAGVAWQAHLHNYRNSGSPATFNNSLAAATEKVINVSITVGGPGDLAAVDAALAGKLLVAGAGNIDKIAGNCNLSGIHIYPARHNEISANPKRILSVGATDIDNRLADWTNGTADQCSNFAGWIDIYAPGKNIYSATDPTLHSSCINNAGRDPSCYTRESGTSFATPIVAGAAAQLWSLNPSWSPEDIHDKILGRSTALTAPPFTDEKLINAYNMLGVPVLVLSDTAPTIRGDCTNGNSFTVASAVDPDLDDPIIAWDFTDQLSYAFVNSSGNAVLISEPFEIDQTTGSVSVRPASCPLDTSLPPYDLTVRVTDSIGMTDELPLTVNVQDASSVPNPPTNLEVTAMASSEDR